MSYQPKRIKINGENFSYLDWGGSGPILHISHSIGLCAGVYSPLALEFNKICQVIGMDSRGHGKTEAIVDTGRMRNWDILYRDLEEFFKYLNQPIIAVGHSMGGTISLVTAVRRPDIVRALVLIEPGIMPPSWVFGIFLLQKLRLTSLVPSVSKTSKRKNSWPDRKSAEQYLSAKSIYSGWERAYFDAFLEHNLEDKISGTQLCCNPKWEAHCIATAPTDIWHYVPKLKIPTLVIYGTKSMTFLPNVVNRMKKEVPQAIFSQFEGGHNIIMERPVEVNATITHFLASNNLA